MPKATIHYPSTIVDRNGNGGWHKNGKRAYRNAVRTIYQFLQTAKEPRLYHLCFEELEDDMPHQTGNAPHKTNMAMLNALVQMAEREGIKCEWFAAREKADATKKDHLHAFVIIDAYGIKVAKLFNQFEDGRVQQFCKAHGVKFAIFSPKDIMGIHGRNTYMALPYQGPGNRQTPLGTERLNDALVWLTYNYKARSKPTDDSEGQIFPASRPKRKPKSSSPPAALQAAENVAIQQTQRKESQNETVHETQTSASSEASSYNTSQGPATAGSEFFGNTDKVPQPSLVDARPARSDGEAQGEASPSIEPQCQSGSRATAYFEGAEVRLTAAQKFLASLYEQAVDLQLDMGAMRLYLLERGVKRTPVQLEVELDSVYGFYGYAASHPPKPVMSVREWDRAAENGTSEVFH